MDDKILIEFLKQKNEELINELSVKIAENEILTQLKYVLDSVLKECDCGNRLMSKLLYETLRLMREHNILVNLNKGIFHKK